VQVKEIPPLRAEVALGPHEDGDLWIVPRYTVAHGGLRFELSLSDLDAILRTAEMFGVKRAKIRRVKWWKNPPRRLFLNALSREDHGKGR
jgi:hypothetical protein